jgi:hypothetical protein
MTRTEFSSATKSRYSAGKTPCRRSSPSTNVSSKTPTQRAKILGDGRCLHGRQRRRRCRLAQSLRYPSLPTQLMRGPENSFSKTPDRLASPIVAPAAPLFWRLGGTRLGRPASGALRSAFGRTRGQSRHPVMSRFSCRISVTVKNAIGRPVPAIWATGRKSNANAPCASERPCSDRRQTR